MNKKGFTLAEVLIVTLLMAMILVGLNKIILTAARSARTVESKVEFNSLVQSLELIFKDEKLCSNVLYNSQSDPKLSRPVFNPDITEVKQEDVLFAIQSKDTLFTSMGQSHGSFQITQLIINEIDPNQRITQNEKETKYFTKLYLEAEKLGGLSRQALLKHEFILWITTEEDRIVSCKMQAEERTMSSLGSFVSDNAVSYEKPGDYEFVVPEHISKVTVEVWGGGGGGGIMGAGAGGYARGSCSVREKEVVLVKVGLGGTPNNGAGVHAVSGGNSSFGNCIGATGGSNGDVALPPVAGGVGTGNYFESISGGDGSIYFQGWWHNVGGYGGSAGRGGAGGVGATTYGWYANFYAPAGPGKAPGGGGAGAFIYWGVQGSASSGGDGRVLLTW